MFLALSVKLFDIKKQQNSLYASHYQFVKKSYFLLYQNFKKRTGQVGNSKKEQAKGVS